MPSRLIDFYSIELAINNHLIQVLIFHWILCTMFLFEKFYSRLFHQFSTTSFNLDLKSKKVFRYLNCKSILETYFPAVQMLNHHELSTAFNVQYIIITMHFQLFDLDIWYLTFDIWGIHVTNHIMLDLNNLLTCCQPLALLTFNINYWNHYCTL